MSNLTVCLNAVFPVFAILLIGYLSRCWKVLDEHDVAKMNRIAFKVFLPVLLFNNIYQSDISTAVRPKLLLFGITGVLIVYFASIAFTLIFFKHRKDQQGVIIQGIFRSNFVIIGLPIASSLVGGDCSVVSILIAVVVPIFNVLAVICLSVFNGEKINTKKIVLSILENPLIIASALGILTIVFKIKFPMPVSNVISKMAAVGSPLMLFLLGAFFHFENITDNVKQLLAVCLGRLVVVPAILLTSGYLLGFRGNEFAALIGCFASSASASSFTMAQQMGGDAELAGAIIVATSALCSFTLFGFCYLFKSLGAF